MPLTVQCACCLHELDQPGALLFSPPTSEGLMGAYPLCGDCWETYIVPIVLMPPDADGPGAGAVLPPKDPVPAGVGAGTGTTSSSSDAPILLFNQPPLS